MSRANDWLEQAKQDLDHARKSRDMGDYGWACFAGQQAAEKAVKALHLRFGQVAWGHSVFQLLEELEQVEVPGDVLEAAKVLDKHYIGPRYPDVHPAGPAYRQYIKSEANLAVELAEKVLRYCERTGFSS